MSTFDILAREFASAGTLDAADLRRLHAVATFSPVADGLAESLGMSGGSEIAAARIIATQCAERGRLEATIRTVIAGEARPQDASAFLWTMSRQAGRPPADIADSLGVLPGWRQVADALERRLSPPKPTRECENLVEVRS